MVIDASKLVAGDVVYAKGWVCTVVKPMYYVHGGIPVLHIKNQFGFDHELCLRDFGVDGVDYSNYPDERPAPRMFKEDPNVVQK